MRVRAYASRLCSANVFVSSVGFHTILWRRHLTSFLFWSSTQPCHCFAGYRLLSRVTLEVFPVSSGTVSDCMTETYFFCLFFCIFFFLISWAQDESQSSELEDQSPKQNQVLAVSNSLAVRMPIYLSSFIYLPPICLLNRSVAQIVLELNLTFLTQLPRHLDYRHGLSTMPG